MAAHKVVIPWWWTDWLCPSKLPSVASPRVHFYSFEQDSMRQLNALVPGKSFMRCDKILNSQVNQKGDGDCSLLHLASAEDAKYIYIVFKKCIKTCWYMIIIKGSGWDSDGDDSRKTGSNTVALSARTTVDTTSGFGYRESTSVGDPKVYWWSIFGLLMVYLCGLLMT